MIPKSLNLILLLLCGGSVAAMSVSLAQDLPEKPKQNNEPRAGFVIPNAWTRQGVVLERQKGDQGVCGDPCIVWDEAIKGWRMVLFYDPPGHAQAVCLNRDDIGRGRWKLEGPLPVVNSQAVGGFHKPFIVMDPDHPDRKSTRLNSSHRCISY